MPRNLRLAVVLLALLPTPAWADRAQTFAGNTTLGGTFQRPEVGGLSISLVPGPMRYVAQEFTVVSTSTCSISSAQRFDGMIFLYRGTFHPLSPLLNYMADSDDGPVGNAPPERGSSEIQNVLLDVTSSARNFVLVTTGYSGPDFGAFQNFIQCDDEVQPVQGSCGGQVAIYPESAICLADRFLVAIDGVSGSSTGGVATPVRTGSTDTGLFWFYNDRNWEVMVKVINGCALNDRWWVFGGALTNQSYSIHVVDTLRSTQRDYTNELGVRAPAIADTSAFATCP